MKSKLSDNNPIRFRLSKENLIIVDASINGNSVPMILDTGAAATVVSKKAAQRFALRTAGDDVVGKGAGGDVDLSPVKIDSLEIGSVTHENFTGMSMDLSQICEKIGNEADGIVGYDFLSNTKLTIDYPERSLLLEAKAKTLPADPDHCPY